MLSCVTDRYVKSQPCQNEMNLAARHNVPIYPLMFEQMQWPPPKTDFAVPSCQEVIQMSSTQGEVDATGLENLIKELMKTIKEAASSRPTQCKY